MSANQAYRLGRTLAVASAIIWLVNNFIHSLELTSALFIVSLAALLLVIRGESK